MPPHVLHELHPGPCTGRGDRGLVTGVAGGQANVDAPRPEATGGQDAFGEIRELLTVVKSYVYYRAGLLRPAVRARGRPVGAVRHEATARRGFGRGDSMRDSTVFTARISARSRCWSPFATARAIRVPIVAAMSAPSHLRCLCCNDPSHCSCQKTLWNRSEFAPPAAWLAASRELSVPDWRCRGRPRDFSRHVEKLHEVRDSQQAAYATERWDWLEHMSWRQPGTTKPRRAHSGLRPRSRPERGGSGLSAS